MQDSWGQRIPISNPVTTAIFSQCAMDDLAGVSQEFMGDDHLLVGPVHEC